MDIRHAVGVKQGLDEATRSELSSWRRSSGFTARERAALELAEALVRNDTVVSDECFVRVREHFSEAETVELVFVIGYQIFASTFAKAFALQPQGFANERQTASG
jgi:alkylhydroperoxidase family enzyme